MNNLYKELNEFFSSCKNPKRIHLDSLPKIIKDKVFLSTNFLNKFNYIVNAV